MTIAIHEGSIFDVTADVIVNPANSFLYNGAGLAKLIHQRALLWDDSSNWDINQGRRADYKKEIRSAKLIPYGGALKTSSGNLTQYKAIIHVVGPIWGGGRFCEGPLLASAYGEALSIAEDSDFESIVFPAISAGIFGVPIDVVATAAVRMCRATDLVVIVALTDPEHVSAFNSELARQSGQIA